VGVSFCRDVKIPVGSLAENILDEELIGKYF
jgi:hypothetical protein